MANTTLPLKMLINVGLNYQPRLMGPDAFNRLLIVGKSPNARNTPTGIYATLDGVKLDYGVEAPEYKIAKRYFDQIPKPKDLMIATVGSSPTPIANPSYLRIARSFSEV